MTVKPESLAAAADMGYATLNRDRLLAAVNAAADAARLDIANPALRAAHVALAALHSDACDAANAARRAFEATL
jgi:hypothetical protein